MARQTEEATDETTVEAEITYVTLTPQQITAIKIILGMRGRTPSSPEELIADITNDIGVVIVGNNVVSVWEQVRSLVGKQQRGYIHSFKKTREAEIKQQRILL